MKNIENYDDYLSSDFFESFTNRYCLSQAEITENSKRLNNFINAIVETIKHSILVTKSITFTVKDFNNFFNEDITGDDIFAPVMFRLGKCFSDNADIEIQYKKLEDRDTFEVYPAFTIKNLVIIKEDKENKN